jgi:hypothetical protein
MSYPIGANSILEIQIVGKLDGQTTRNVFHYWYETGSAGITDGRLAAQQFGQAFADTLYTDLMATVSTSWTLQYIQSQWIEPNRWRAVQQTAAELAAPSGGSIVGNCTPSGVAVRVSRQAEHSGHAFQGGNWFAGIPESLVVGSQLTIGGYNNFLAVASDMLLGLTSDGGEEVSPVIIAKGAGGSTTHLVETTVVRPTIRYQRRREVGQGE